MFINLLYVMLDLGYVAKVLAILLSFS
jgi:hypothetical protein